MPCEELAYVTDLRLKFFVVLYSWNDAQEI